VSTWTLIEPTLGYLPLTLDYGYVLTNYEIGSPTQRENTQLIPNADGEDDFTTFMGSRVVLLQVRLPGPAGDRQAAARMLRAYHSAARRVTLLWDHDDPGIVGTVQIVGRGLGADFKVPPALGPNTVAMSFRCPDGIFQSTEEHVRVLTAASVAALTGRVYDTTYDRVYPAGTGVAGATIVPNAGSAYAWPVYRLYGPLTNPRLRNLTSGGDLNFNQNGGLVVIAGDYIEIRPREATANVNGGSTSVLNKVDYSTVDWSKFRLAPGDNTFTLDATSTGATSRAEITYRDAWI
jgi:hypothetical protein